MTRGRSLPPPRSGDLRSALASRYSGREPDTADEPMRDATTEKLQDATPPVTPEATPPVSSDAVQSGGQEPAPPRMRDAGTVRRRDGGTARSTEVVTSRATGRKTRPSATADTTVSMTTRWNRADHYANRRFLLRLGESAGRSSLDHSLVDRALWRLAREDAELARRLMDLVEQIEAGG